MFFIAEVGINHNGDLQIAKDLIRLAKEIGCDAVKFQKRTIDLVYRKDFLEQKRQSPWGITQRDQKEGLEFSFEEYDAINDYCQEIGMDWFSSIWDIESFDFIKHYNLKYYKIASPMIIDEDLLHLISNEKKYTFISTGMSNVKMIDKAVNIFNYNHCPFELMHCVSIYPTPIKKINLKKITTLQKRYNCKIGFSDHSSDKIFSLAAVTLGITSLERHFTLDKRMYGSDQFSSLDPIEFKEVIDSVKMIEECLGNGNISIDKDEVPNLKKLRSHLL